jgi:BirA family biotin operon repressor/biotin-[acetyl-CoA-carboxylase] ligase
MPEEHPSLEAKTIAAAIKEGHVTGSIDWRVEVIGETVSTSDLVLARGLAGEKEGYCLFAESQSAGRGRRGDAWLSPLSRDLLFSILLRPEAPMEHWPRLPQLAAVALCRAIDRLAPALGVEPQIKWPNDIWLNGRKVAGLLVETRMSGAAKSSFAVLGIGLNVNGLDFPDEIRRIATSLRQAAGGKVMFDRNQLAATLLGEFGHLYPQALDNDGFAEVQEILHQRSCLLGRKVCVNSASGEIEGMVEGFGPNGELILITAKDERKTLHSADHLRLLNPGESD